MTSSLDFRYGFCVQNFNIASDNCISVTDRLDNYDSDGC